MFRAVKLARWLDLREVTLDGGDLAERFMCWFTDAGDDYAFESRSPPWGHHHGSSPILCGLQVKTWSESPG
jgi:hypothetical protein